MSETMVGTQYAGRIREAVMGQDVDTEWEDSPGYEGKAWDLGLIRLYVEDIGAESVKVFAFDEFRVQEAQMEFVNVPADIVAQTIIALGTRLYSIG